MSDLDIQIQERFKNVYFAGKAGSGKTAICEHFKKVYGFKQVKMAYPVYHLCEDYLGMVGKDRQLLQFLGTDVGREMVNPDIWVNRMKEDIFIVSATADRLYGQKLKFVSDDVRFPNEHEAFKSMGWVGIYLDVPDEVREQRLMGRDGSAQKEFAGHASETSIDLFKSELIRVDASRTKEEVLEDIVAILSSK
jgi:dephospho-CoA kinase